MDSHHKKKRGVITLNAECELKCFKHPQVSRHGGDQKSKHPVIQ